MLVNKGPIVVTSVVRKYENQKYFPVGPVPNDKLNSPRVIRVTQFVVVIARQERGACVAQSE